MNENPAPASWLSQPLDRTYRLLDRLGQGGMGTVFRAVHLLDGRSVAIKLVAIPEALHDKAPAAAEHLFRLALAREFQMLASLHHPNVVRVFSYGFDPTLGPYVAMELLENCQHFMAAASQLEDTDKVVLLAQLLRALVYIHQRGVIHRDIKPGNVLVMTTPEGPVVKLLDFGIATVDAQTVRLAGTVEYMAPELLLGNPPTPATDLWSVGILLYQMLMGRFPFADLTPTQALDGILGEARDVTVSSSVAAFQQQYRRAQQSNPSALQWTAATSDLEVGVDNEASAIRRKLPSVPTFMLDYHGPLEGVLCSLLARNPKQRFQDAKEVLVALCHAMDIKLHIETSSTRESFLQATALTGRDLELEVLKEALHNAGTGHGSAWLLGGESGVGKSRLLFELRTLALVHGAWVAEGQAVAEGGSFFQGFPPLLRALCLRVDITDAEAAILKDLAPEVPQLLCRPIPEAVKVKPEESLQRLADTILTLFTRQSSPLLLLFEDLHWATSESLALLGKLLPQLDHLPVLLVASFRSDECPDLPTRLHTAHYLPLSRLTRPDIERLSVSILGHEQIRPDLIDYLERQTEGNVFFLVETLRSLAESAGELRRIGEGELPEQVLTSGIERIIEKRLERLQSEFRPVLELSAVLGRQLEPALLEHLFVDVRIQDFLIQAANAAILEQMGTDWRFTHDKLREGLLRRMTKTGRQSLHSRIAEAMEATYSEAQRQRLSAILAYHFREAGLSERAVAYFLLAGTEAWRLYLLENASMQYTQAEVLLSGLPETATTRGQRADLLIQRIQVTLLTEYLDIQVGREKEARALLQWLRDSHQWSQKERKREARLNLYIGRAYYFAGQSAAAIRLFKEVIPVAREFADQELLLFPACTIGQALYVQGHLNKSIELLNSVVEPLQQLGYVVDSARAKGYQAIAIAALGQYKKGITQILELIEQAKQLKQHSVEGILKMLLMLPRRSGAEWPSMLECTLECIEYSRKSGDKVYLCPALALAGWAEGHLGYHERAAEHFGQALTLARAAGNRTLLMDWTEAGNAERLLLAGDAATALSLAQELAKRSHDAKLVLSEGIAERVWGAALSRLDASLEEAEVHLQRSLDIHLESGNILDMAQTERWWGRIHRERGDESAAQAHFSRAQSIFDSSGCEYARDHTRKEAMLGSTLTLAASLRD